MAFSRGARVGAAVADTHALTPGLTILDADPEGDARARSIVAHWCLRFSPVVAPASPDDIFLDIDGCAHLWGGEAAMAEAVRARLAAQGLPSRIAVADTFGVAWALAHHGADDIAICRVPPAAALAPLPAAALRLDETVRHRLARLGLRTVAQLARLPRAALTKRFGEAFLQQYDRALGVAEEPLAFLHPPRPWTVRRVFADPLLHPEALATLLRDLADLLCGRLAEEGLGARRFALVLHRVDGEAAERTVAAALPLSDARRLTALFAPKLETVDPGFGVEVGVLVADDVAPRTPAQTDLVAAAADARNADLAPLIDRLRNRLGPDRVWRAAPHASHVPERAVVAVDPLANAKGKWPEAPRPLRLFSHPQPVEAMAPVPDDPPVLFRWRGRTHRVRSAEGPERIAAEWWRRPWDCNDEDRIRDYYRVEDQDGVRYWLFRTGLYGSERPTRWWLHGLFG